jgi:hypothetical protein
MRWITHHRRRSDGGTRPDTDVADRGFVVAEWIVGMCFLLVPAVLLVGQLPQWAQQQSVARAAAAEGARAALLTNDAGTAAQTAEVRAKEVAQNYGHDPGDLRVDVSGEFAPGESITVTVTLTVDAIVVPFVGSVGETSWSASSTERVGDYRVVEGQGK